MHWIGNAIGVLTGVLIAGALGGLIVGSIYGVMGSTPPTAGLLLALPGFLVMYLLVKYVFWHVAGIRPALRWLYPYESWEGGAN